MSDWCGPCSSHTPGYHPRTPPACKRPARRAGRRLAPGGAQATPGVVRSTPTAPRRGAGIIWTAVPVGEGLTTTFLNSCANPV